MGQCGWGLGGSTPSSRPAPDPPTGGGERWGAGCDGDEGNQHDCKKQFLKKIKKQEQITTLKIQNKII